MDRERGEVGWGGVWGNTGRRPGKTLVGIYKQQKVNKVMKKSKIPCIVKIKFLTRLLSEVILLENPLNQLCAPFPLCSFLLELSGS